MAGETYSYGAGNFDFWVIKFTETGIIRWQKTYGGSATDNAYVVQQTGDGGYIVGGHTVSYGAGSYDIWLLKLNYAGMIEWQKTYGGSGADFFSSLQETLEYGFIIVGSTNSFSNSTDAWIFKINSNGAMEWQYVYSGIGSEVSQTDDYGYVVAGTTNSFGAGNTDLWVLKLDERGGRKWQKTYGGSSYDGADYIKHTNDGDYIIGGRTNSYSVGESEIWIMKIFSNGSITDDCPIIYSANASSSSTNCKINDTSVSGSNTSVTISTPATSVVNTNANIY